MRSTTAVLLFLVTLLTTVRTVVAQRPKTAEEALRRVEQVKDGTEADRRRPVGDLGAFTGPEVTAVLLAELARAKELGYLQTVVRALGEQPREGIVGPLTEVLRAATNNRLMDSACEGLARQGDAGVQALGEVLAAEKPGSRRQAVCDGLGRADGDAARDLLLREVKTAGGRDRLPALRGLQRRAGDALVDELRLLLATDKDTLVAAIALRQLADHRHEKASELAQQLLHRLSPDASAEHYTAALRGLLVDPTGGNPESILVAAARAEDPFGKDVAPAWTQALATPAFVRWLGEQAPTRKVAEERALAAMALGRCAAADRAQAAPALAKLLAGKELDVVRAAALALAGFGPELGLPPLQKLLAGTHEGALPIALQALHELRHSEPGWAAEVLQHTSAKSAALRAAALGLLAQLPNVEPARAIAAAADNLAHKQWPVRSAAIDLLVARRDPAGIPLLIERLEHEQGRLLQDVQDALFDLTQLRLGDAAAWRAFWQKEGPTFRVPAAPQDVAKGGKEKGPRGAAAGTGATYWDIPVRSDRVAFVVDVSGSMNQPFGTGGGTRLDEAKRQLVRVLGLLPAKAKMNVITFGNATDAFAPGLQSLDEKRRKAAEAWTQALVVRGATNVHAGLQRAFADPEVDTIFLLTDGQPSTGDIVEPGPLAKAVAGWNLGRGLRIHTVAIGGKSDFLERLARESGGEHAVAK